MDFLASWNDDIFIILTEVLLAAAGIIVTSYFAYKTNINLKSMQGIEETLAQKVARIDRSSETMKENLKAMQKLEKDLDERVLSVEDATRRLRSGLPETIETIIEFLTDIEPDDSFYVMTDTAAIGRVHQRNKDLIAHYEKSDRDLSEDTNKIRRLLYDCAITVERFFITTLDYDETIESGALTKKFLHPVLEAIGHSPGDSEDFIATHVRQHARRIEELRDCRRDKLADCYVDPHRVVSDLPLQLFIRFSNKRYRRKALVLFTGTFNMEKINEVRAMATRDPKLVETFISMYETISGLDEQPTREPSN